MLDAIAPDEDVRSFADVRRTRQSSKSPRVIFSTKRVSDSDWQIEADCPGAEIRYIKGLTSKEDVDEWLAGERKVAWLRSQGYAE